MSLPIALYSVIFFITMIVNDREGIIGCERKIFIIEAFIHHYQIFLKSAFHTCFIIVQHLVSLKKVNENAQSQVE